MQIVGSGKTVIDWMDDAVTLLVYKGRKFECQYFS